MSRRRREPEVAVASVPTKRCAIYTRKSNRVSTDIRLSSLEAQRDVGLSYVDARSGQGWGALPDLYDDGGYTGANLERPAFRRLLADIDAGKIDVVVVYKVDRLSRSLLDFAKVMGMFERRGVAFVSVTQNFSTADAIGRLTLNLLMAFAEFEREMTSERTRDKVAASRRRGHWTGGVVPFGYRTVDRRLVADATTSPLAREVFAEFLRTGSIVGIIRMLDAAAPRIGRGGKPQPWDRNGVRRILDNPVYAGFLRVDGSELARGEHEALIDRATFDQVHQHRSAPRAPQRTPDGSFFLRGLGRCGGCGGALVGAETRRARRSFRYYRCHTRDRRGTGACALMPIRADDLEALVLSALRTVVGEGALTTAVFARAREHLAARVAELAAERARLRVDLAAATARADEVARRLEDAGPSERAAAEPALTMALAEAATADRRLIAVDAELTRLRTIALDQDWVTATLAHFDPVWAALTAVERARLIAGVVAGLVVEVDRTVQIRWQPWLEEATCP